MQFAFISFVLVMGFLASVSAAGITGQAGVDIDADTSVSTGSAGSSASSDTSASASADSSIRGRALGIEDRARVAIDRSNRAVARTSKELAMKIRADYDEEVSVSNSEAIEAQSRDIDASASLDSTLKASTFAQVSQGEGWAVTADEGAFARIMLVEKSYVKSGSDVEVTKSRGIIKIVGHEAYNLELTSKTDTKMTFNVTLKGKTSGTLVLDEKTAIGAFSTWGGELKLDSGKTYTLSIATMDHRLKGEGEVNVSADGTVKVSDNGAKVGFWSRFRGLFKAKA